MKKKDYILLFLIFTMIATGLLVYFRGTTDNTMQTASVPDTRKSIPIPVIMYHGITDNPAKVSEYFISVDTFAEDLKWLKDNGYTAISAAQLINYVRSGEKLPSKPVMLTFDDGYCNNYTLAYPLLQKNQMKAIISIIGSESDISSDDIYRNPSNCNVSWGEIALMSRSGLIELGNHTYNLHTNKSARKGADRKPGESPEDYRKVLFDDLTKNQSLLEAATGTKPVVFAWPFGAYPKDRSADPILMELGFKVTLTSYQHTSTVTKGDMNSLFGLGRYLRTPEFNLDKIKSPE